MRRMAKPFSIFMLYSIALTLLGSYTLASTLPEMTRSMDQWFKTLNKEKATLTKLQVYIHANFAVSKDQTVFQVASASITSKSPTTFGRVLVIDNPLTTGPEPDSQYLGRYQGWNAYSDFNEPAANMNMNIIFSEGSSYNGSTISIVGRQPVNQKVRVLVVAGGTGDFRFAKGIVLASTVSVDPATSVGTYVYVMYVVTPSVEGSVQKV
ncbi:hypothetical protein BUALT_Bualt06G0076700 [Buddleja alternifolia]|uniref:Dirigent protein n=1 Tax=Buddleja alternifolia TaxID=168488 RepID=A0AAV6XDI4_9LAMI|nr:hypothetical protein BUALT_Bualt06G0076700 [Buddleja alternifolia]